MLLTEYDEKLHVESEKEISYQEGYDEGRDRGIRALISLCRETGYSEEDIIKRIRKEFEIEESEAKKYL